MQPAPGMVASVNPTDTACNDVDGEAMSREYHRPSDSVSDDGKQQGVRLFTPPPARCVRVSGDQEAAIFATSEAKSSFWAFSMPSPRS
jgi:hypothetical protein